MKRPGMLIAVGLLVLVNAFVLGGAAYNRSGDPDSAVTLTERELPLSSYYGYADRENTGLSLRLTWSQGRTAYGTAPVKHAVRQDRRERQKQWFDQAKLESVGFDCSLPLSDPRSALRYDKLLPRKTFAVLEFEGDAWKAWLADDKDELAAMEQKAAAGEVTQKELREARQEHEREARTRSRLFVVDVGNDPAALRRQYGDRARFLILPATVRLTYHHPDADVVVRKTEPFLEGSIDEILTESIYVPKEHRALPEKFLRTDRQTSNSDYGPYAERQRDPAYAVSLRVGRRHEPWVAGIRPLPSGTAQ